MSLLNVIIPIQINSGCGGDIDWCKFIILTSLTFLLVIFPLLIYCVRVYVKHKREYPMSSFYWQTECCLAALSILCYMAINFVFLLLWLTEVIYEKIC